MLSNVGESSFQYRAPPSVTWMSMSVNLVKIIMGPALWCHLVLTEWQQGLAQVPLQHLTQKVVKLMDGWTHAVIAPRRWILLSLMIPKSSPWSEMSIHLWDRLKLHLIQHVHGSHPMKVISWLSWKMFICVFFASSLFFGPALSLFGCADPAFGLLCVCGGDAKCTSIFSQPGVPDICSRVFSMPIYA